VNAVNRIIPVDATPINPITVIASPVKLKVSGVIDKLL
tara:strand:- start:769 stop:882 length:114 start_codon:yes stop_codon:yes gene_type:complete